MVQCVGECGTVSRYMQNECRTESPYIHKSKHTVHCHLVSMSASLCRPTGLERRFTVVKGHMLEHFRLGSTT